MGVLMDSCFSSFGVPPHLLAVHAVITALVQENHARMVETFGNELNARIAYQPVCGIVYYVDRIKESPLHAPALTRDCLSLMVDVYNTFRIDTYSVLTDDVPVIKVSETPLLITNSLDMIIARILSYFTEKAIEIHEPQPVLIG